MMPYIYQNNHFVTFVIPDNTDIHVDAALKKICSPLDTFCSQGWGEEFSTKINYIKMCECT